MFHERVVIIAVMYIPDNGFQYFIEIFYWPLLCPGKKVVREEVLYERVAIIAVSIERFHECLSIYASTGEEIICLGDNNINFQNICDSTQREIYKLIGRILVFSLSPWLTDNIKLLITLRNLDLLQM